MGWLYGGIAVVVVALLLVGLLRSLRFRHARGDLGMQDNPSGVRTKPAGIADVGVEAARRSPRIPPAP